MDWMLMPLRRYADFSGRSQRQEYWLFVLFSTLLYIAAIVLLFVFVGILDPSGKPEDAAASTGIVIGFLLIALLYLGLFIPTLAVKVRRLHDQDLSGWFVLLGFIPYLGGLIIFIFMCIDGTAGPNRFGADPKGRGGQFHANIFA
jgi:uncharacterized membrane protein YhaH (DUF805 family)